MNTYLDDDTPGAPIAGWHSQAHGAAYADQTPPLGPDCIDGSQDGLRRFLAEMAQTMGEEGGALVLELDGIVVSAMAAPEDGLMVVTRLPRAVTGGRRAAPAGCELAWHAELGCEVLLRHLPLAALRSEPDVLDAMLDCADLARVL